MKRLVSILTTVLAVPEQSIHDSSSPATIPSWDSFNGLVIMAELERAFRVKFTLEEIHAVRSVGELKEVLKAHGVKSE